MIYLLDTHILLWAAQGSSKLPAAARHLIENPSNQLWFSAASIWEVAIKAGMGRQDFQVNPSVFRTGLLTNGYSELAISGQHSVDVGRLPALHSDPFDRMLIAQANAEGIILVTADSKILAYQGNILAV